MVKNLPAKQETWVQSLGWKDPLEKRMATHSSIHAWKIPWTEEPGELQSTGSESDTAEWLTHTCTNTQCFWCTCFIQIHNSIWASQVAQGSRNCLPLQEMQEIQLWSPGRGDPSEEEMATHSSIPAAEPMDRGAWQTTVHGVTKSQSWLSECVGT